MQFKEGDIVLVKSLWNRDRVSEVTEITAAGNVRVKGEHSLFSPEGKMKPVGQSHTIIRPISQEEAEKVKHEASVLKKSIEIREYLEKLNELPPPSIEKLITQLHKAIKEGGQ